jgi:hypothetical protein
VSKTNRVVRKGKGIIEAETAAYYTSFKLSLSKERLDWFEKMAEKGNSKSGLIRDALDKAYPLKGAK